MVFGTLLNIQVEVVAWCGDVPEVLHMKVVFVPIIFLEVSAGCLSQTLIVGLGNISNMTEEDWGMDAISQLITDLSSGTLADIMCV